MEDEWFHIDLGNQINNTWNKDSALAVRKGEEHFSIKIKSKDKKLLKKKFILEDLNLDTIVKDINFSPFSYVFPLMSEMLKTRISEHCQKLSVSEISKAQMGN